MKDWTTQTLARLLVSIDSVKEDYKLVHCMEVLLCFQNDSQADGFCFNLNKCRNPNYVTINNNWFRELYIISVQLFRVGENPVCVVDM